MQPSKRIAFLASETEVAQNALLTLTGAYGSVPLDRAESSGLLEMVTRLPEFDVRRLSAALTGPRGTHEVWVHPAGGYSAGSPEIERRGDPGGAAS